MCNECFEVKEGCNLMRRSISNGSSHCLSDHAIILNYYKAGLKIADWYINGIRINVGSQEEFEKSKEYREWKLRVFK
jgi:hypothetical protein